LKIVFFDREQKIYFGDEKLTKEFFNDLHDSKYYGLMMVYHSTNMDYLIQCARHLDKNHNFKFMIAIRSYAISPEYCYMIFKSFNNIQKDRVELNLVAGDLKEYENSLDDIVYIKDSIDTPQKRIKYSGEWLEKFLNIYKRKNETPPKIMLTGDSYEIIEITKKYADSILMMKNNFETHISKGTPFNKLEKSVAIPIFVSIDAEIAVREILDPASPELLSGIYASFEGSVDKLKSLSSGEFDAFFLTPFISSVQQNKNIHNVVKKVMEDL